MSHSIRGDFTGRLILLANRLHITYWLIRLSHKLAPRLPRKASYAVAVATADLLFGLWRGIRQRTTENMRWVDPHRSGDLARAALRNYARYLVDFLRFPAMGRAEISAAVRVDGLENLHRAMAGGKGAIAIGFHIGNIDLGAAVLAQVGYPVNVVVDRFDPPALDTLIRRQREEKGLKLISLENAARQGLRALRRNEVLALLIDKPSPQDGVVVKFFGGEIAIPGGAAVLSLRSGAPVVPCCMFRRDDGGFTAEVAEPVHPEIGDVQDITQRLVETLEAWVRRHPEQWYPFRKMWLTPSRAG